jgi:cholesterol transport system auxiliary component
MKEPMRWPGLALACMVALLSACAGLPQRASAPTRYDFGPPAALQPPAAMRPLLALQVQASPALDTPAMLYRLDYADARQLRVYAQSRWAMLPAELLQQRLRAGLGSAYTLVPGLDGATRVLHVELEELSHVYLTPEHSYGLLRMRVTLLQRGGAGDQVLAQRDLQFQQAAVRPDAASGVQALGAATEAAVAELVRWLLQTR